MGHPTPNREPEASFKRKLVKLAGALDKERLAKFGYRKTSDYVGAVCARLYPRQPAELQTAAPASA